MSNKNTKRLGLAIAGVTLAMVLSIGLSQQEASALNYVVCVSGVVCQGTEGDDYIVGTSGADTIYGAGGNDIILGNAGNDVIHGDGGHNGNGCTSSGCEGADVIYGGDGNDRIHHDSKMNSHNAQDYEIDQIHCGNGNNDVVFYKPGTSSDDDRLLSGHGCEWKITADQ